MKLKIVTILGARPQFIKAAPVCKAISEYNHSLEDSSRAITELIVHTGQHYDYNMSQVFFKEMHIPRAHVNLGIGSGSHGKQTGEMLIRIEQVLASEKPDWVLVYGDTNSTLAGALAATKLHIPVAHVEAGLRSFNREMPEEHNRVLTDHCADLLFCPSRTAVANLKQEGIVRGVHWVGDTMYDAVLQFSEIARARSNILERLQLLANEYYLATIHRPYNTDNPENLSEILKAFVQLDKLVIFPMHPRTKVKIEGIGWDTSAQSSKLIPTAPVGYLDMLVLEKNAHMILTDSGGMQKEAYFLNTPCITLRPETEWVETVEAGWNLLAIANQKKIIEAVTTFCRPGKHPPLYGDGSSATKIVGILLEAQVRRRDVWGRD